MAQIYDTAEIRRAARTIKSSMERVTGAAEPKVRSIRQSIDGTFEGAAANALEDKLQLLDSDMQSIASALGTLSNALFRFAEALDEADRRLKSTMN